MKVHVAMELLSEGLETMTLSPTKNPKCITLPPRTRGGDLLLADPMFFIKAYLAEIIGHGGSERPLALFCTCGSIEQ